MRYSPSINIERDTFSSIQYIPTPNAKNVSATVINGIKTGFHSFNIIGTYGTGKSSFLMAFEENFSETNNLLFDQNLAFDKNESFEFLNIVGDYASFQQLIRNKLGFDGRSNFFKSFDNYYADNIKGNQYLFIVVDEFGKVLEHAANSNPEEELYFIQQFSEYISDSSKKIYLITTLHQNFTSYAFRLSKNQRNEWEKVKGRFKEVVFNEPVEQLLFLASSYLQENGLSPEIPNKKNQEKLYGLAFDTKFINSSVALTKELADNIYPMDLFSAYILTLAIQKYGQNERSLFSFLESEDQNSLKYFVPSENETFNIADVYNYIEYNFYSYLVEVNQDSTNWTALKVAIERVEALFDGQETIDAYKLVKTIGLLNIFAKSGTTLDKVFLISYAKLALGVSEPEPIIDRLVQAKVIRYAIYKSQYVLFEGTDLDIDVELLEAGTVLRKGIDFINKLKKYFDLNYIQAKAISYQKGTPRFFEFIISDDIISKIPIDEIDGYINLIFSDKISIEDVVSHSKEEKNAIIYAYYANSSNIQELIFEIDKYQYVLDYKVDKEDWVAKRELEKGKSFLMGNLKNLVVSSLFSSESEVKWIYNGQEIAIPNSTVLNRVLSDICDAIYNATPVFKNELLNKYKLSSTMSTARNNFLNELLENSGLVDLGIDKFPPEKAIYRTMLKNTGIHREDEFGGYQFFLPNENSFIPLWQACEDFFETSKNKARKVTELTQILNKAPFKLKPGFLDIWLVTYLIIKKEDYALYSNGKYVPFINKEVLELLIRKSSDFSIKAFDVSGVKLDLFNKYREVINLAQEESIGESSFIETIRPFLTFYKQLPEYAKNTKKLSKNAIDLRDTLAKARDPEDTFFVDLPNALGFVDTDLLNNPHLLTNFVNILRDSIRELRTCYNELLNRIETYILETLGIKEREYESYKPLVEKRYKEIKEHLLPAKQKAFHARLMANLKDRKAWLNSLTFTLLNKPLENLFDEEEEWLLDKLKHTFIELLNYVEIQKMKFDSQDEVFKFDITSIQGGTKNKQIVIPKDKISKAKKLEEDIKNMLSSDDQLNIYALLKLLENKM
ncbi:hypothetical protein M2132_002188 [Dysgonomonas sp. PH5-45]|uniref:hypothetical protein n=1 Tax=unclassified Dysgonomonas TaxID=2630389 RepID=UPI002475CE00|nr:MULTISPECIES: hypothetical protein [unclassified Dysgonomonas]MDH6355838.1 hypothetical protein [Dysgonomonas sp. PH5-45]MDH6388734.1 hypothetical protein [Dysgonomonas sp. PH5-37]